ncbi:MAG: hypothetical protein UT13_C0001G0644 [Candidatus Pacebacteria bacterium GW2011_GWF2_38_9]|nr:MAG: hypothetical protein UT13_C0001G0644 [Candidatus Pacebacteria bacterium GW2011_GWF2_38_9]
MKTLKNGFSMPMFGLGTWQMGGRETRDFQNNDQKDISAIQKAIELGIMHIDTAESYADGYAETLLGQAILGYDRSKLFLTTKIHAEHLKYDDVLRSCEASLKRMRYRLFRSISHSFSKHANPYSRNDACYGQTSSRWLSKKYWC